MSTDVYLDFGPPDAEETIRLGHLHSMGFAGPHGGFNLKEWMSILVQSTGVITASALDVLGPAIALKAENYRLLQQMDPEVLAHWLHVESMDWDDIPSPELAEELRPFIGQKWSLRVD